MWFVYYLFFFFNDTATTEIYTLSLHDALPIWSRWYLQSDACSRMQRSASLSPSTAESIAMLSTSRIRLLASRPSSEDRKSTRLNSSHANISYAVFCLKKKKKLIQSKMITYNVL